MSFQNCIIYLKKKTQNKVFIYFIFSYNESQWVPMLFGNKVTVKNIAPLKKSYSFK